MLRITSLLFTTAMLSGCFGSSSNSDSSNASANYSYYFGTDAGLEVYSYDHNSENKKLIFKAPTEMEFSTQINDNGVTSFGTMFMFKAGIWQFVTPKDNTVKVIAEASNISEVCSSTSLQGEDITYLYYMTPSDDAECSSEADNLSYRIDTSMSADSSALLLPSGLLFADEFQNVIISDDAKGFLIKREPIDGTVLFANLDLTSTVNLEGDVTGYVLVNEFSGHDSINIKLNEKLYDLTLAQLEAGNIGEAFFTGSNINVYTTRSQLFYTDNRKIYQYDLANKESALIYDIASSDSPSNYISGIKINNNGLLVHLNSSDTDFIHLSTSDLNTIRSTEITLMDASRSSRIGSIVGGFTYSLENVDGTRKSSFISDTGVVSTIDNSEWINITSSSLDAESFPILLTYGETGNTLSKWSVDTKSKEFIYGILPKDVSGIRSDSNDKSNTILLSTLSKNDNAKGLLYSIDRNKAGSLKALSKSSGFTVVF